MLKGFWSHLFPSRCLICGGDTPGTGGVCGICSSRIRPVPEPVCRICGSQTGTPGVCLRCQSDRPPYDRLISAAAYEGTIKDVIHAFKYRNATYYKAFLGQILCEVIRKEEVDCDLVTFVPLHWTRMISRGYNQSALIAREAARLLDREISCRALKKTRRTLPQVGLGRDLRKKNVRGAFRAEQVKGRAVLVVDDVVTTGQTAREASKALKQGGAARVVFACVGRMLV